MQAVGQIVGAELAAACGPAWEERLVAFEDRPAAAASIGQVHRGQWRDDDGRIVEVAVKVQYPGVGTALRSDLRQGQLLARGMGRISGLKVSGLADELASRVVEELDYVREGRVQAEVAAAFTPGVPLALAAARAAGAPEPPGRTDVVVPAVYLAAPRVLITGWLEGASLSALLDGRTDLLPEGWRELDRGEAADRAGSSPRRCWPTTGRRRSAWPGRPAPWRAGAQVDPQLIIELLRPYVATAADDRFTYSRPWLRGLMAHFNEPRFASTLRNLTPPPEYALVWRATLASAGLFAQLGATVPTRAFHLAYSPGFRDGASREQDRAEAAGVHGGAQHARPGRWG